MDNIFNGVFFIGLLSLLSLAAADEFSEGTANYVEIIGKLELSENDMKEGSAEYNGNVKIEIFTINGEGGQCLYKVLRTSRSIRPIRPQNIRALVRTPASGTVEYFPPTFFKGSCKLSPSTLGNVVSVYNDDDSIEYRLKETGKCLRITYWKDTMNDEELFNTTNNNCKEVLYDNSPELNRNLPYEARVENRPHFKYEGYVIWDDTVAFMVKSLNNDDDSCDIKTLEGWYKTGGMFQNTIAFLSYKTFQMSCGMDVNNLHRVAKKIGSDTLVYKFFGGWCVQSKLEYDDTKKKINQIDQQTFKCDKFLNPVTVH